jgi:predicted peroxiredoxin
MRTVLIMVNGVSSGKVAIYRALQFVLDSMSDGYSVEMFLEGEAVLLTQKEPEKVEIPAIFDESIQDCKKLMKVAITRGAKVKVCEGCAKGKSLQQSQLHEDVEIPTPQENIEDCKRWLKECDKIAFLSGESFECYTREEIENRIANLKGLL